MKYTIKAVGDPREWSNDHGRFYAYPLDLEDEQGNLNMGIEWSRKADSKAPKVGDELIGKIQGGQHGEKIKIDWDAMNGKSSGGGGGSNGRGNWKPEAEFDPEKVARITRAHAQQMAVRTLTANPAFNQTDDVATRRKAIVDWTDFFEADVEEAAAQAKLKGALDAKPAESTAAESAEKSSDDVPF